jgi:hypothetical protein
LTLVLTSQKVSSIDDLVLIEGEFESISQKLNIGAKYRRINYSSQDTLTFIHLRQYGSRFQISYSSYDKVGFINTVKVGDKVKIHINKNDLQNLNQDINIRGFSLKVNNKSYSEPEHAVGSLNGGKKFFLIASGIILIFVIHFVNRTYNEWIKKPSL